MLRSLLFLLIINAAACKLKLSTNSLTLKVGESTTFQLTIKNKKSVSNNTLTFVPEHEDLVVSPTRVLIGASNSSGSIFKVTVVAIHAGKSGVIITKVSPDAIRKESLFLLVYVYRSNLLQWISNAVGWMYFLSWSVYYYPQIYTNFRRKSVVGLNFDYLLFGIFGYTVYGTFNIGLFCIPPIQEQYAQKYPRSIIPVQPNDLFSSTHSFLAFSFTIFQSLIYEKGNQTLSKTAKIIAAIYITLIIVFIILACLHILLWLDVLYLGSYIKLCINLTYYIPQVRMNYKRKSTEGWNIVGAMLDMSGGFLSILQMVLNGYNYGDWKTIVENPTKFGIGILTLGFSSMFMVQHFILYKM